MLFTRPFSCLKKNQMNLCYQTSSGKKFDKIKNIFLIKYSKNIKLSKSYLLIFVDNLSKLYFFVGKFFNM